MKAQIVMRDSLPHLIKSKFKFLRRWILTNSENMKDPWIFKHVTYSVTEFSGIYNDM